MILVLMLANGLELTCGAAFCAQIWFLMQLIERTFCQIDRRCHNSRAAVPAG
jgi:hypothetical protein